ncbi:FAD dependent oxidoreductase [Paenibacillus sp. UNCCL117]|uniref:FAD-dependent oxidoreductase n=1 Tax=unclassified Paenibacillus TaxID=185978 RepID=UPI000884EA72|nr:MULTISPECIES: FAD-dependent oxidoreductase [unclassified Paenibacillus]SDD08197.1 FAD dependent oxidoreductase [Paenibacillus sp. cl123]SFW31275.1 FAD dependent oxidoreductase [Paenibacillus sp. UNCCL117]
MIAYDVVVYGATPGGIGAALASARRGLRTLLAEPTGHLGGLMTSGLGRTDLISREACGAVFREFADKVQQHYESAYGADSAQAEACNKGLFFEPSVAMSILKDMLAAEPLIEVKLLLELKRTKVERRKLTGVTLQGRPGESDFVIEGGVFIDATYEGDLAAMAGVPYRLGRESRDEWNEEYAGRLYMTFDPTKEVFPGSTGEGDDRIQAYNFRLCLTQNPDNFVPVARPERYNREDYASLVADVAEGRVRSIRDVSNMLPVPNGKTDCNNHHYCMCSTDLPEENTAYADGTREVREAFIARQRDYIQGLLWFLQHDAELPEAFRSEARSWGYAADEFTDTGHFPPQIYVREARRIEGEYTFTENDARLAPGLGRAPVHHDSIAIGDYPIDSHATRKRQPEGRDRALEGFLGLGWLTKVYQIPYGIMVPKEVDGLLVPVAVSATHMGFGTIRMEPCWMQLGFAAGVAAELAVRLGTEVRRLPIDTLQAELLEENQRITYFDDVEWSDPARKAAEYFGTKGFFSDYKASLAEPLSVAEASQLIARIRALPGCGSLPVLPASAYVLPAGVDMGPRLPKTEADPAAYWQEHPLLSASMAERWWRTAARVCGVTHEGAGRAREDGTTGPITRGEFIVRLYELTGDLRRSGIR